jgi:hypothetical protein
MTLSGARSAPHAARLPATLPAMRRALLLLLTLSLIAAGCGSSSSGSGSSPLSSELSFFPPSTPFVLTLQTGQSSKTAQSAKTLEQKFPQYQLVKAAALSRLQQAGINYQQDIKPLLGNPVAVGVAGAGLTNVKGQVLIVWVTHSASTLHSLLGKAHAGASTGSRDGFKLYAPSGAALAVNGATLVLANDPSILDEALDRHAHDQGITPSQYATALAGLDQSAAVDMFGQLSQVLAQPKAATARKIPWVAALRSYGVAFTTSGGNLAFQFHLDTNAGSLSDSQLPIASGSSAPALVNALPIQAGIRDPAQLIAFIESALRAASPRQYAKFKAGDAKLRRRAGFSINDVLSQLSGDLIVSTDSKTTLLRAAVSDPAKASRMLAKVPALGGKSQLRPVGGGLYSVPVSGARSGLMGIVGHNLVLAVPPKGGRISRTALRSFSSAPAATVPNTTGAVAFRIAIRQLLALEGKTTSNPVAQELLNAIGDLTGSMSASPSGLTGVAKLALR